MLDLSSQKPVTDLQQPIRARLAVLKAGQHFAVVLPRSSSRLRRHFGHAPQDAPLMSVGACNRCVELSPLDSGHATVETRDPGMARNG
jgi:hypothetical protein